MPKNLFLPTEDETAITLNFRDGQPPITVDAIDIEIIVRDIQANNIPEDTTLGHMLVDAFNAAFNRKMSRNAAIQLWNAAYTMLVSVKKKLHEEESQSDTSTSQDNAQSEN